MSQESDQSQSTAGPSGSEGRAKIGVAVVAVLVIGAVVGALMVFGGEEEADEEVEEVMEEGFDEAFVAGDEPEQPVEEAVEDEPQEVVEEIDAEEWDGEFRTLSNAEIRAALQHKMEEHDEPHIAVEELEMSIRRSFNDLEPEARREFALNFDRAGVTRIMLTELEKNLPEEEFEEVRENVEHWQGDDIFE